MNDIWLLSVNAAGVDCGTSTYEVTTRILIYRERRKLGLLFRLFLEAFGRAFSRQHGNGVLEAWHPVIC